MDTVPGLRRILVAVDGSRSAEHALDFAIELAVEHQAMLLIVHVVPIADPEHGWDGEVGWAGYEPTDHDRTILANASADAALRGLTAMTILVPGNPVEAIVDVGERNDASLIVVGSRGHGALISIVIGSVSLGVLRRSARPVVIVHGAPDRQVPVGRRIRPWFLHDRPDERPG